MTFDAKFHTERKSTFIAVLSTSVAILNTSFNSLAEEPEMREKQHSYRSLQSFFFRGSRDKRQGIRVGFATHIRFRAHTMRIESKTRKSVCFASAMPAGSTRCGRPILITAARPSGDSDTHRSETVSPLLLFTASISTASLHRFHVKILNFIILYSVGK